ncbi:TonB-dependent receptor [Sporomusa ovata]|uniref:TonB-dependent receptor n=1 Tax=Sporomusa ovata TaxID=2378 RepID=UPI0003F61FD0|nr:TonB-dependent receptor [Sporomusa ovata]
MVTCLQDKWNGQIALRGATGRSLAAFTSSSYWVVDVAVDYKISADLPAYCKGYNLTNRAYELNGSEGYQGSFPMVARRFTLGLEQRI